MKFVPLANPAAPQASHLQAQLEPCSELQETLAVAAPRLATTVGGDRYLHSDVLCHRTPPEGLSHEQLWVVEKLSRRPTPLPLLASGRTDLLMLVAACTAPGAA